jgi:hypothetical protein
MTTPLDELIRRVNENPDLREGAMQLLQGLAVLLREDMGDPNRVLTFSRMLDAKAEEMAGAVGSNLRGNADPFVPSTGASEGWQDAHPAWGPDEPTVPVLPSHVETPSEMALRTEDLPRYVGSDAPVPTNAPVDPEHGQRTISGQPAAQQTFVQPTEGEPTRGE